MATIGINPNEYYTNTWRENDFISQAFQYKQEEEWKRTRQVEWRIMTMAGRSLKTVFKSPDELYKIGDETSTVTVLEGKQGEDFLKKMFSNK